MTQSGPFWRQLEFLESIGAPLTLQGGDQPRCRPFAEWPDERAMNGGFDHFADTYQRGRHNIVGIAQFGAGHTAITTQDGHGNAIGVIQGGHGNSANVTQVGKGNVSVIVQD